MERYLKVIIILICIIFIGFVIYSLNDSKEIREVCFNNSCYKVEVSKTSQERSRGLMFREYLKEENGMLFIFSEEGKYGFWMKNTYIPLDIIWISQNNEVVQTIENIQPCKIDDCLSYGGHENALYVLEVNSGEIEKNNIKIGDEVEFKYS